MPSEAFLRRLRERTRPEPDLPGAADLESGAVVEERLQAVAWRLRSRLLDCELWLARDERTASELVAEGVALPVLVLDEVPRLADKPPELLRAVLRSRRAFPGSRWVEQ